ncbi:GtrA family protein [Candidatus Saccharibacteria bacterium]|nr:GtrA family protein [Candidatus Saccharibacteria bacterium]
MAKDVKNKILKFIGVGLTAAAVDYGVYELCLLVLFGNNNDYIVVSQLISLVVATFVAFILHSNITWKGRDPGKYGIIKFFIWNLVVLLLMRSFLSWFFALLTGLYEFGFMITSGINLPLSFEFVQSTAIFILMNIVTMTVNYFFYDNFIFGKPNKTKEIVTQRKSAQAKDKSAEH